MKSSRNIITEKGEVYFKWTDYKGSDGKKYRIYLGDVVEFIGNENDTWYSPVIKKGPLNKISKIVKSLEGISIELDGISFRRFFISDFIPFKGIEKLGAEDRQNIGKMLDI